MTSSAQGEIRFDQRLSSKPLSELERARKLQESPGWGQVFTDHMVSLSWSAEQGWHDGRLEPYGPLRLDPATSVFHSGQEIFEGMKAYRLVGGEIVSFRPDAHAARFSRSARRMSMPELPEDVFVRAIELLVKQDREWVPTAEGHSLYLRPFMFSTERTLVEDRPSSTYQFMVIASPVSSYFPRGVHPVTVRLEQSYSRAAPGGTGDVKVGPNYAATFVGQQLALDAGCDQVLWLDALQHRWLEELGGMNVMVIHGTGAQARIETPQLTGALLPGITRDSLLKLSPDLGIPVTEVMISVEDWRADCQSGEISEMFACGSAAVITPIGNVKSDTAEWAIGDGNPGPVTMRLREHLVGIQFGKIPDPYGWIHRVC